MNTAVTRILQQLTGSASLDEVRLESLQAIAAEYPWFGPAQLLAAKKQHSEYPSGTIATLEKTALYFSNPYWLHFLLSHEMAATAGLKPNQKTEEVHETATIPETILPPTIKPFLANRAEDEPEEYPLPEEDLHTEVSKDPDELRLSGILELQAAEFRKPIEPGETLPIKSSPLYTIDYFASQGIHIESIKAGRNQQQLDSKVKKFTDWLKQMKTVNPQPTDLGTDEETEHVIEAIAQNSNETKDIITEAMAEVLIKQGKTTKAVQLYKKLSFLNPDKSAYFAGKIDKIKGN